MDIKMIVAPFFSFFLLVQPLHFPERIDEISGIEIIRTQTTESYITQDRYHSYLKGQIEQYAWDLQESRNTFEPLRLQSVSKEYGLPPAEEGVIYVIPEYIGYNEQILLLKLSSVYPSSFLKYNLSDVQHPFTGVQLVPYSTTNNSRKRETRNAVDTLTLVRCAEYARQFLDDAKEYDRIIFADRNTRPLGIMAEVIANNLRKEKGANIPEISYLKCTSEKKIRTAAEKIGKSYNDGYDAFVSAITRNIPSSDNILIIDDWTKRSSGESRTLETTIKAFNDAGFSISREHFWPFIEGTGPEKGYVNPRFFDEHLRYILPSDWGKVMEWKDEHLCIGAEWGIDRIATDFYQNDSGEEISIDELFVEMDISKGPHRFLADLSLEAKTLLYSAISSYPLIDPKHYLSEKDIERYISSSSNLLEQIKDARKEGIENISPLITNAYHERLKYHAERICIM
jgi:hypothetical protein